MGLSSSQARLLNLTARMHQIEYKAAKLEAQKLQMANESRRVYDEYLDALDATKVQIKTINNKGSFDYIDATYNNLLAAGYRISVVPGFDSLLPRISSAKLLNDIVPITDSADIPEGYTPIYTADDLSSIGDNLTGKYILMNDIAIPDSGWTPIGSAAIGGSFSGILDGNGHSITNFICNHNVADYSGLFCSLENAKISNLGIEDANVTAGVCSGILAGTSQGSVEIENCYVVGEITGVTQAGGFVGENGGTIKISDSYVNVTMDPDYSGIYMAPGTTTIKNSYFVDTDSETLAHNPISQAGATSITEAQLNGMVEPGDPANANSTEWLTNMIKAGAITISKPDSKGNLFDTSVAIDTGLQEVADESNLRKAEAKYEADMRKIDAKDRKYDTDLAAIEAERNAIKSEMETLKTVAKDNVERTFKLFS